MSKELVLRLEPVPKPVLELALVKIPAGSFQMGSDSGDSDEKPVHRVTLTKPFYMGRFLVTQEQYQMVMGVNPSHFKGDKNPVECVSWDDAQEFCKKLSASSGKSCGCPRRRNGNMPAGREARPHTALAMEGVSWVITHGLMVIRKIKPIQWARKSQISLGYTTCMAMSGSGVKIGLAIIRQRRLGQRRTPPVLPLVSPACCAAALGTTFPGAAGRLAAAGTTRTTSASMLGFGWRWRLRPGLVVLPFAVCPFYRLRVWGEAPAASEARRKRGMEREVPVILKLYDFSSIDLGNLRVRVLTRLAGKGFSVRDDKNI